VSILLLNVVKKGKYFVLIFSCNALVRWQGFTMVQKITEKDEIKIRILSYLWGGEIDTTVVK